MSDIDLGNIDVDLDLDLDGAVDIGLDAIAGALTTGVKAGVTVGGGLDVGLSNVKADLGLDDIRLKELAPIRTDSKVDLGLDDIRIRELPPIRFELGFRPIRVHLPLNYAFCIELFGIKLFKLSLCGEGMTVAEDYHPRATERCG